MKILVTVAALSLLAAAPALAHQEPDKDKQQEEKKAPDKQQAPEKEKAPERKQGQAEKPKQEQKEAAKPEKQQEQRQAGEPSRGQEKQAEKQQKEEQKQENRQARQGGQANQQARGDGGEHGGRRIPDDRFRAHFGREHHFHVGHIQGDRFEYGGYGFELTQAWPSVWGYDDDFYIDDEGGVYYLIDLLHPEVRLVVIVVE